MEVEHAARDAARATIAKAEAELLSKQATLAKAKVDVAVAQADLAVADSEAKRLEAWVGYITLPAPYDGVIVARNANTFDFVLPRHGRPHGHAALPDLSPAGDRRADLRGRPHRHRPHLRRHSRAGRQLRPDRDQGERARPGVPRRADSGTVTRTSWALNVKSRTLRAEIDLPNPGSQLLPGMYAYAKVIIERPGRPGAAGGRPHLQRRKDLLLELRERAAVADRDPDRHQRRRVDRGHQPSSDRPPRPPPMKPPGRRSTARNR